MKPTPIHEAAMADLKALLSKHGDKLSAVELLALASQLVGVLVALQDQCTMTPGRAMAIVAANVEEGNAKALEGLLGAGGRAN